MFMFPSHTDKPQQVKLQTSTSKCSRYPHSGAMIPSRHAGSNTPACLAQSRHFHQPRVGQGIRGGGYNRPCAQAPLLLHVSVVYILISITGLPRRGKKPRAGSIPEVICEALSLHLNFSRNIPDSNGSDLPCTWPGACASSLSMEGLRNRERCSALGAGNWGPEGWPPTPTRFRGAFTPAREHGSARDTAGRPPPEVRKRR